MEYEPEFAKSFMQRTLAIANGYQGPYDATLLINCLVGLLVVPKEVLIDKVPDTSLEALGGWGVEPGSIKNPGKCDYGHQHKLTLRQFVRRLRNAVAHFKIDPFPAQGEVQGFDFRDRNGFHASLSLLEIKQFVIKLSQHLENEA